MLRLKLISRVQRRCGRLSERTNHLTRVVIRKLHKVTYTLKTSVEGSASRPRPVLPARPTRRVQEARHVQVNDKRVYDGSPLSTTGGGYRERAPDPSLVIQDGSRRRRARTARQVLHGLESTGAFKLPATERTGRLWVRQLVAQVLRRDVGQSTTAQ
ncbi:hypothetical protein V5799_008607 [Amblyomma americanum]|uniref:Uncharacterized protein n=1 Tax=Amblyomma americanum TaxID=6943 RepID=A0AAQ4FEG5_AMBAM